MLCRQIVPRRDRGAYANTNLQFSLTKFDGRRLAVCLHGRSVFHVRILRRRAKLHTLQRPATACGIELSRLCAVLQVGGLMNAAGVWPGKASRN